MKAKLLLTYLLGLLLLGCSVDPIEDEIIEQKINTANSHTSDEEYSCAGPDNNITLTLSEAIAIPNINRVKNLYLSLLEPGVATNGTFDPSVWNIIRAFNSSGGGNIGDYTTIYTVLNDECSDSVELTIRVVPDQTDIPSCDLDAGEDNFKIMTVSEAKAIPNKDKVTRLYLSLLEPGVPLDGTFDPSIWNIIRAFDSEGSGGIPGDYSTTYTVSDGDCTDSVILTLRIIPDFTDPIGCELNAGEDAIKVMTLTEAKAVPNADKVKAIYLSLLEPGVPWDGTFDPGIWDIIKAFGSYKGGDGIIGDYTTTYTITEGECSDSVVLTIRVVPD
ncbi:hypothetical protein G3I01_11155 [Gramella sp. MT6]|uniref:hypothetical protein n=1 Tax=Gramella sp. MT6 TaxID=2705471 RepID=UPI001C5E094B|nr:hypothetical protein [Gramella sp. MT6]QYA26050.1 hypothetical protein G3I01_11155 [Gramella sp. MT6]